jgi:hypothetical protein
VRKVRVATTPIHPVAKTVDPSGLAAFATRWAPGNCVAHWADTAEAGETSVPSTIMDAATKAKPIRNERKVDTGSLSFA